MQVITSTKNGVKKKTESTTSPISALFPITRVWDIFRDNWDRRTNGTKVKKSFCSRKTSWKSLELEDTTAMLRLLSSDLGSVLMKSLKMSNAQLDCEKFKNVFKIDLSCGLHYFYRWVNFPQRILSDFEAFSKFHFKPRFFGIMVFPEFVWFMSSMLIQLCLMPNQQTIKENKLKQPFHFCSNKRTT